MAKNNSPIGIFDSGLGGLTVVKQIIKLLPHENIVYLGDTARVPYGTRSPEVIKRFSEENTEFLISKKVKCIVIACNTSSAVAASHLKKKYKDIPIFEVIEPASKEAVNTGKKIGVIGTRATINSLAYEKLIRKYSKSVKIFVKACPLFVPFIEEGEINNKGLRSIIKTYLDPIRGKKIDTLIMGCTHYPIIRREIEMEIDNHVKIIDPGISVSVELKSFLESKKLLNLQKSDGDKSFYVTDLTDRFVKVAEMFLGHKISGSLQKINLARDKKIDKNITLPKFVLVKKGENFMHVHKVLSHPPYFVKPFEACDSVGESLIKKNKQLGKAIKLAHKYSSLAIVGEYTPKKNPLKRK